VSARLPPRYYYCLTATRWGLVLTALVFQLCWWPGTPRLIGLFIGGWLIFVIVMLFRSRFDGGGGGEL
jgi:hypothetical protein